LVDKKCAVCPLLIERLTVIGWTHMAKRAGRINLADRANAFDAWAEQYQGTPMKEYRLTAWPELSGSFGKTAYSRMLADLSHRYMSMAQLVASSGIRRNEVQQFLEALESRGVLIERELFATDSVFDSLRPIGGWIRKALNS
jgi:hypothetical protein